MQITTFILITKIFKVEKLPLIRHPFPLYRQTAEWVRWSQMWQSRGRQLAQSGRSERWSFSAVWPATDLQWSCVSELSWNCTDNSLYKHVSSMMMMTSFLISYRYHPYVGAIPKFLGQIPPFTSSPLPSFLPFLPLSFSSLLFLPLPLRSRPLKYS